MAVQMTQLSGSFAFWPSQPQWFSNMLKACGLVRVASLAPAVASGTYAGAADYSAMPAPSAGTTDYGWEIWRFADALHATFPVYFKFTWRTGVGSANIAMKLIVGTGWDGASTVNGNTFAEVTLVSSSGAAPQALTYCVISADTNRVAVALWAGPDSPNSQYIIWGIERLHDAAGGDVDEGVFVLAEQGQSQATHNNQVVSRPAFGGNGNLESKLGNALMPRSTNTTYAGDAPVGVIFPMRGKALYPSRNFILVNKNDLGANAGNFSADHYYGVSQRWYNCARGQTLTFDSSSSVGHGMMMRMD